MKPPEEQLPRVVIVGGGLAGIATAVALAGKGLEVELLEAKQSLGGRAGSYREREEDGLVDHCQHVAMGCCTNFLDLCRQTGCDDLFTRDRRLHFFSAEGVRSDFEPASWLPAPLHLLPALLELKYLSWRDKWSIMRGMVALMRTKPETAAYESTVGQWLLQTRQTPAAIERFWKVVLVSALGESLERASLSAARKVFVDGFLANGRAADVLIPRVSLGQLYDERVAHWLRERGVRIRLGTPVKGLRLTAENKVQIDTMADTKTADVVIAAVPWRRLPELLDERLAAAIPGLADFAKIESSPISSIHLWTDRRLTSLPHAVLVDRLSQWVFARAKQGRNEQRHYYQIVISAARQLAGRERQSIIDEAWQDLQAIFPAAREAKLLSAQLITQREAVFSVQPGLNAIRPVQRSNSPALVLAGDWTATGWPATMEGAVRSGYLAAEAVLHQLRVRGSIEPKCLVPDLPRGLLARLLIR
ncbi:hydroxysqualene dehydroxylase HpnE [Anatilimnocola aggregata]|uniref:hydroxysqualene dehydroxylase HpnE n=1 Tax=Anatilimnocola aggregata TaxID=2528021 RepID=UPI00192E565B|nr:hydroxysqualene dehydroxylase HpnE [Anatilimnocola aggregata]